MPLDETLSAILEAVAADAPEMDFDTLTPEEFREINGDYSEGGGEEVDVIENLNLANVDGGEMAIRIYRPKGVDGRSPAIVFFHGGGWVVGNLNSYDGQCRGLANRSGAVLIAVDYRKAPEHPFPTPPEDCYSALCQIAKNSEGLGIDSERIAVAGDSAGANLATVVCQMSRDRNGPKIKHQMLFYGCFDIDPDRWPSHQENIEGPILPGVMMRWFYRHYVGAEKFIGESYAAPIHSKDFSGLPSAQIITGELDILRDEGEAYAKVLKEAGVETYYECIPSLPHAFLVFFEMVPAAREVMDLACKRLADAL